MFILTDNTDFTEKYMGEEINWLYTGPESLPAEIIMPAIEMNNPPQYFTGNAISDILWNYLIMINYARESHFDLLDRLSHDNELPDGFLCIAKTGDNFHGFRNRPWQAIPGNIHLSVHFTPNCPVENVALGFTILSAVSVVETLDEIRGLEKKAAIKWVNDIVFDKAKVAGVIAKSQLQGNIVKSALVGIGLNVEATPDIKGDRFVTSGACINDFLDPVLKQDEGFVFRILIDKLAKNYRILIKGGYKDLLDVYIKRSIIIGKEVSVWSDPMDGESRLIKEGVIRGIGENLELYFEGTDEPVRSGRIKF